MMKQQVPFYLSEFIPLELSDVTGLSNSDSSINKLQKINNKDIIKTKTGIDIDFLQSGTIKFGDIDLVEAKENALQIKSSAQGEINNSRRDLQRLETQLETREENLRKQNAEIKRKTEQGCVVIFLSPLFKTEKKNMN